jgi:hypothetical protein
MKKQNLIFFKIISQALIILTLSNNLIAQDCKTTASTNIPMQIPSNGTATSTLTIPISENGTITAISVVGLTGVYTDMINPSTVSLKSPSGTIVNLYGGTCTAFGQTITFNYNFNDTATTAVTLCPPNGTYRPIGSLET